MIGFSCHSSVLKHIQYLIQAGVFGRNAHWPALAHAVLVSVVSPCAGAGPRAG